MIIIHITSLQDEHKHFEVVEHNLYNIWDIVNMNMNMIVMYIKSSQITQLWVTVFIPYLTIIACIKHVTELTRFKMHSRNF